MERAVALKKLRKIFGKQFAYEIDANAASTEERAAAQAAQPAIHAEYKALSEALQARQILLLNGDAEYQQIKARLVAARKVKDNNNEILMRHKICVGTVNGMFFSVEAQADSWEQVFAILEKKKGGV